MDASSASYSSHSSMFSSVAFLASSLQAALAAKAASSSALRSPALSAKAASSSRYFLASSIMRWMSSSSRRPRSALIWVDADAPVTLSRADTARMPFASSAKVTSTLGSPLRARSMPSILNSPSLLLADTGALALVDVARRVLARLRAGDGRRPLDERRHDAALELDAQGQRRHVEEHEVLAALGRQVLAAVRHARAEDRALDRRADGDGLVGVHGLAQL